MDYTDVLRQAWRTTWRGSLWAFIATSLAPYLAIAAGLLHDTVEDTKVKLSDIRRDFGDTIAVLVDGVTKLTNLPRVSRDDQHAETKVGGPVPEVELEVAPASLGRRPDLASETLR